MKISLVLLAISFAVFFSPNLSAQYQPFTCNATNPFPCNYLSLNNNFSLTSPHTGGGGDTDPFFDGVSYWARTHGSPQINVNDPKYNANTNHASMWTTAVFDPGGGVVNSTGEGIAIGIPMTSSGTAYNLSLYKRYRPYSSTPGPDVDNFYVVLLTCARYNSLKRTDFMVPGIPSSGAQKIYDEPNVSNTNWQSISKPFTANGAYDVLWIFPKNSTTADDGSALSSWLEVTLPVLQKTSTCPYAPLPEITTASYFQYGTCSPAPNPTYEYITPGGSASVNHYCFAWECSGTANFISNIGTNNQWYVNDVLVTSTGHISGLGYVDITNPGSLGLHIGSIGDVSLFKVQLKNTTYGYSQLTTPTYVYLAPGFGVGLPTASYTYGGTYKPGQPNYTKTFTYYSTTPINYGPNAVYTWTSTASTSGCIFTDANTSDPNITITFPSTVPSSYGSYVDATMTVTNSYCNRSYNFRFYYDPNGRNIEQNSILENSSENDIKLFPNPANDMVNIDARNSEIYTIELYDLYGTQVKKISGTSSKKITLNTSDLKPGIYNCHIITNNGIQNQKLVIKK